MRDDWDQFTWVAIPKFLEFDETHADGADFAEVVAALYWQELVAAFAEADAEIDRLIYGNETGEPRGFLGRADAFEPTPADRAFAILEPHLHDVPLYQSRGRILRWPHV